MASDEGPSGVASALATTGGGGEPHRPDGDGAHQPPSTMSKTRMKKDERRKKLEEKMRNLETTRLVREERERKIREIESGRGLRSSNDSKAWKCQCGRVNQPIKRRFFDVPRLHCRSCKAKFKGKFKFCMGEVEVEGGSLIGEILDQKKTRKCVAYSYSKADEISQRVSNVNHGKDPNEVVPVNPDELQEQFDIKWPAFSASDSLSMNYGLNTVVLMGLMFKEQGMQSDKSGDLRKLEDLSTIPRDDFEEITHCLASGIPLIGTYHTGNRRGSLRYCQIYKSPCRFRGFGKSKSPSGSQNSRKSKSPSISPGSRKGKSPSRSQGLRKSKSPSRSQKRAKNYGHAVVLIGAGMEFQRRFLYYVSSWGERFCARRNKHGQIVKGGIGKIRAGDLTKNPVKVSQPHITELKRRLETQSSESITKRNYLLMMSTKKQMSDKMVLDARRSAKLDKDFEKSQEAFCDDEAGYPQYNEDRYHHRGKGSHSALLENQGPNQHNNPAPSIVSDSITGNPTFNLNLHLNPWSTNGIIGTTRTSDAAAVVGLGLADLKSMLSGRRLDSTDLPDIIGSSDPSISTQIVHDLAMLQTIMPDQESMNKVFASDDDQDELSTDPDELIESEDSDDMSGDEEDMFRNLLSRAEFSLTYGDNNTQPQVTLREKILTDASAIAGFLTGLRVYLHNPAKVKRMLVPTKGPTKGGGTKDSSKCDSSSTSLINLLMGVSVLKEAIIDLLLDIMVECCQPSDERSSYGSSSESSKTAPDSNGASSPPELIIVVGELTECACRNQYETAESNTDNSRHNLALQNTELSAKEMPAKILEQASFPSETPANYLPGDGNSDQASPTKWPDQSEELLGLIVNSLKALDCAVPHGCPEPRKRPKSVQKVALVLEKAPKKLQPDLIALVPKLVDGSEHSLAACALLDHLQKADAEPSLRLPVFGALSELEFDGDVWKRASFHALELLFDSSDEPLVAAITYVLKAASQCQHIAQAVKAVRWRLKRLGTEVPSCVLDFLSKTVHSWPDVAEALLKDIGSDPEPDSSCLSSPCSTCTKDGLSTEGMPSWQEQAVHGSNHLSDVFVLIEMLSIPGSFVEVAQVLERALLQGAFGLQLVAMVLERRHSHRLSSKSGAVVYDLQDKQALSGGQFESSPIQEGDFPSVLALGEVLSLSSETRVQDFVRMLYAIMFKIYAEDHYRYRILKGLVDRATNTSDNCREVDIDMDVLVFLVKEDFGIARPVLSMMREAAEVAQADRANLWHQICATEDENIRLHEEMDMEQTKFTNERAVLAQRLTESEATTGHLRSELKAVRDRYIQEKKELSKQMREIEKQMEWVRSEKDEQIAKLSADRKNLHDRVHEAEMQLSQFKARKREELKKVTMEKNTLAERLKIAEASKKRFDDELKRHAAEIQAREEIRKSLDAEVRRLKHKVGQTEGEKKEKEDQIARCEAYIDGMESKLQVCQQYIRTLETSLQEEMSRHAPLYGVGVEALSLEELETLANIHEQSLRQIHVIRQRKGSSHLLSVSGLFPLPSLAVGPPSSVIHTSSIAPNGVGTHGNWHRSNAMGPWFSQT